MAETERLKLYLPTPQDSMANTSAYINDNFDKLENSAVPPVVTALPTTYGEYEIGDRILLDTPRISVNGSYILIAQDENWGPIWRPIQPIISPWTNFPESCISNPQWFFGMFQYATCNRGFMYWRANLLYDLEGFPEAETFTIFHDLPVGARPSYEFHKTVVAHNVANSGNGVYRGGRIFVSTHSGNSTFRFSGSNTSNVDTITISGLKYAIGGELYFGP